MTLKCELHSSTWRRLGLGSKIKARVNLKSSLPRMLLDLECALSNASVLRLWMLLCYFETVPSFQAISQVWLVPVVQWAAPNLPPWKVDSTLIEWFNCRPHRLITCSIRIPKILGWPWNANYTQALDADCDRRSKIKARVNLNSFHFA